jgi:hypothetical protein
MSNRKPGRGKYGSCSPKCNHIPHRSSGIVETPSVALMNVVLQEYTFSEGDQIIPPSPGSGCGGTGRDSLPSEGDHIVPGIYRIFNIVVIQEPSDRTQEPAKPRKVIRSPGEHE